MFRQNELRLWFTAGYRLACVLYFIWLDYQILYKIVDLFLVRVDVFIMYSRCLGLQFVSFHNTMMQQAFFWMSLRADIAELMDDMELSNRLGRWADFVFKYGAVPLTTLVCVNFWVLYAVLDWPMAETNFIRDYMPPLLNHGMHTVVIFLNVGELALAPRHFPMHKGIFRVSLLVLIYSVWTYITKMISGRWPYVFLKDLSYTQHFVYAFANVVLAVLSYVAAAAFNNYFWRSISGLICSGLLEKDDPDVSFSAMTDILNGAIEVYWEKVSLRLTSTTPLRMSTIAVDETSGSSLSSRPRRNSPEMILVILTPAVKAYVPF